MQRDWHSVFRLTSVLLLGLAGESAWAQSYAVDRELTWGSIVRTVQESCSALSHDGTRVAISDGDRITVRDATLTRTLATFDGERCTFLVFGPKGRLYAAHFNGSVARYDVGRKKRAWVRKLSHAPKGARLHLVVDGDTLIVTGPTCALVETKTGRITTEVKKESKKAYVLESPKRIALTMHSGKVEFFDYKRKFKWKSTGELDMPKLGIIGSRGEFLLGQNADGVYELDPDAEGAKRIYKAPRGYKLGQMLRLDGGWLSARSKKGKILARLNDDFEEVSKIEVGKSVWVWSASKNLERLILGDYGAICSADFSQGNAPLAALGHRPYRLSWTDRDGIRAFGAGVLISWHPERGDAKVTHFDIGRMPQDPGLVTDGEGSTWFDPKTRQKIPVPAAAYQATVVSSGDYFVVRGLKSSTGYGYEEKKCQLLDRTGKVLREFEADRSVQLDSKGTVYRHKASLLIAERLNGKERWRITAGKSGVRLSPAGDRILVGNRLLATESAEEVAEFPWRVRGAAFSEDGGTLVLATSAEDGWAHHRVSSANGTVLQAIELPDPQMRVRCLSGDGKYLVVDGPQVPKLDYKPVRERHAIIGEPKAWRGLYLLKKLPAATEEKD